MYRCMSLACPPLSFGWVARGKKQRSELEFRPYLISHGDVFLFCRRNPCKKGKEKLKDLILISKFMLSSLCQISRPIHPRVLVIYFSIPRRTKTWWERKKLFFLWPILLLRFPSLIMYKVVQANYSRFIVDNIWKVDGRLLHSVKVGCRYFKLAWFNSNDKLDPNAWIIHANIRQAYSILSAVEIICR